MVAAIAAIASSLAIAIGAGFPTEAPAQPQQPPPVPPPVPGEVIQCAEQRPQDFLIRGNYVVKARHTPPERLARQALHQKAIQYRTEQYGFFPGFGRSEWNAHPPMHYVATTTFMSLRVRLHRRIIPAVQCAEQEIRRSCQAFPYRPVRLSGIRDRNTYHTGEITNHAYGIAIDIDPHLNTCCRCTAKWRAHPLCARQVDSIFERMSMPECWVTAFEKYGFYWLGHDQLQDTMHFEFLGDADRILAGPVR
jgi:hypothetical protein